MLSHHYDTKRDVAGAPDEVFSYLDDHRRLADHMSQSSWMMLGSRMSLALDERNGRAVGSKISLTGSVLGLPLHVAETVTERVPPVRKTWESDGEPQLVVIGRYRMQFEIAPAQDTSRLSVSIDYDLPAGRVHRWLGRALGEHYARWCVDRMAEDAQRHFAIMATGSTNPNAMI